MQIMHLDSEVGMPPRPVLARQFHLITRRCTQRQLLLRPDRETNNAFTYCLIEAALRYGIEVLLPCAMSTDYAQNGIGSGRSPVGRPASTSPDGRRSGGVQTRSGTVSEHSDQGR